MASDSVGILGTVKQFTVGYVVGGFLVFLALESFQWVMFLKDGAIVPIDVSVILPYQFGGLVWLCFVYCAYRAGQTLEAEYGKTGALLIIVICTVGFFCIGITIFCLLLLVIGYPVDTKNLGLDILDAAPFGEPYYMLLLVPMLIHAALLLCAVIVAYKIHKRTKQILQEEPIEVVKDKMVMVVKKKQQDGHEKTE